MPAKAALLRNRLDRLRRELAEAAVDLADLALLDGDRGAAAASRLLDGAAQVVGHAAHAAALAEPGPPAGPPAKPRPVRLVVAFPLPRGATPEDAAEYVRDALLCESGLLPPDAAMLGIERGSITVETVAFPRA